MNRQNLELVKTITLFLMDGVMSSELVLPDPAGSPMYFKIMLKRRGYADNVSTNFNVIDGYHAEVLITTNFDAITTIETPIEIGDYNNKTLYFDYVIEPIMSKENNNSRVTVSFYTD